MNYLTVQHPPPPIMHSAPMVTGDVFSNTAAGPPILLDAPNGFDYPLHEVRLLVGMVTLTGRVPSLICRKASLRREP